MNKLAFKAPAILRKNMTLPDMLGISEARLKTLFEVFQNALECDNAPESLAYISRHVDTPQELIFLSHTFIKEIEKSNAYSPAR